MVSVNWFFFNVTIYLRETILKEWRFTLTHYFIAFSLQWRDPKQSIKAAVPEWNKVSYSATGAREQTVRTGPGERHNLQVTPL